MEVVWFTIVAVVLYFGADRLLETLEIRRGERFKNRSLIFLAILLPSAVICFWILQSFLVN